MTSSLRVDDLKSLLASLEAADLSERSDPRRMSADDARRLLRDVDELLRTTRRELSRTPRVHLLAALNRERDERAHCHLLRWLLDPVETHGYAAAFLEALLSECGIELSPHADLLDAEAETEVPGANSRIDVEVSLAGAFLVHVEAKIGHYERADQTEDETLDLAQRCKAKGVQPDCAQPIFLTLNGESPSAHDEGAVRPWQPFSWERMAEVLRRPIEAHRHEQTALIEHVLDCFEMLTRGGVMKSFEPDEIDRLLIENWDKVTKLAEARDRLAERVRATFSRPAFKEALRGSSFERWDLALESGHKYDRVYIAPPEWPRDATTDTWTCFGFDDVTVETLFSDEPEDAPPITFYWTPLRALSVAVDDETEGLRSIIARQLPRGVELEPPRKSMPIRWRPRLEVRSHPERIPQVAKLVVEEWERMAPLIPKIDELVKKVRRTGRDADGGRRR
jgi:hypothetical protein